MEKKFLIIIFFFSFSFNFSQNNIDNLIFEIISKVSEDNLKKDIISLANFGTRHTLSDTLSKDRGIGAARRWIKNTFEQISNSCNNCMEVFYQKNYFKRNNLRLVKDVWINNVVAVQKGYKYPNRYVIMSGDIDSRVSDPNDYMSDSPGANDNATGMAGTIEAARVLSKYKFENSIIYLGLSGEEQGLYGGQGFAEFAKKNNWEIIGVLNNDMIGNIEGVNGTIDNRSFRIFSEPVPANETDRERYMRRFYGGEVDGNSRQLARFIYNSTKKYMPEMRPNIIYRLDRFGRGGHHRPFNDLGFAGVRIMESNENYNRQHQDLRVENGIKFGDVIDGVDFNYVKKLTTVNIVNLILIGSSPPPPKNLSIGGIVEPSVKFKWDENNDKNIKGYKIYWRETSSPHWQFSRYIGKLNKYTLDGIIIDNYLFSVTTVSNNGYESIFEFPSETFRN